MRSAILMALLGLGMVMASSVAWDGPVGGAGDAVPLPASRVAARDLISLVTAADEGGQQLVLIDSRMRVMAVYHIGRESGEVTLKSVRNFKWDLQMLEFNGTSPRPQEIRAMMDSP